MRNFSKKRPILQPNPELQRQLFMSDWFRLGRYYGQKLQDQWVIKEVFNGKRDGFFLDIAAADGIRHSNTYTLEKHFGWTGICVEANHQTFPRLQKNRKATCIQACLDATSGEVEFFCQGDIGGIVAEDTDNNYRRAPRRALLEEQKQQITTYKTISLESLLISQKAPKVIDFFSFDVEGAEERILSTFPFERYTFLSLAIERPTPRLNQMLFKHGYVFVRKTNYLNDIDSFYVHRSLDRQLDLYKEPFSETPPRQ